MNPLTLLLALLIGHFVCDYPLQGDFLARGKNHKAPIPGVPYYQCMVAHAAIHAGTVWLITGSVFLGLLEFWSHGLIDTLKCNGHLSYNQDQCAHFLCKVMWVTLAVGFNIVGKI